MRERFDRPLVEWVPDPSLQQAWREHLRNRVPARLARWDPSDNDESPPWEHATELLADGLIDANAALTPRGRRALSRRQ